MSTDIVNLEKTLEISNDVIAHNMENGWPDLDPKRKAFCFYYIENYDHRDAAKRAGFSVSTGSKLLRETLVAAFIGACQEKLAERSIINRDFVNVQWLKLLPKIMGEEEVPMVTRDGDFYEAKKFHASEAVRIVGELSKSTNFYAGGSGGTAAVTVNINLEAMGVDKEKPVGVTIESNQSSE